MGGQTKSFIAEATVISDATRERPVQMLGTQKQRPGEAPNAAPETRQQRPGRKQHPKHVKGQAMKQRPGHAPKNSHGTALNKHAKPDSIKQRPGHAPITSTKQTNGEILPSVTFTCSINISSIIF
ncbi:MAG TPA: hypothetical protein HA348_02285 [Thermoplasmata archaeon]|nr:hypothetical protein [Thermoplasmata archaeon]